MLIVQVLMFLSYFFSDEISSFYEENEEILEQSEKDELIITFYQQEKKRDHAGWLKIFLYISYFSLFLLETDGFYMNLISNKSDDTHHRFGYELCIEIIRNSIFAYYFCVSGS